jgi:hypothetical protein
MHSARKRLGGWGGWLAVLALTALTIAFPIRSRLIRLLLIGECGALWLGLAALLRRRRALAGVVLAAPVAVALWLCLPGAAVDAAALRAEYLVCARRYVGVRFIWGGENARGLDCSGFVRRGLVDALWRLGWRTGNPRLVRASYDLWWHDASAKALGEEHRGQTVRLGGAPSVNAADHRRLRPGDLAVLGGTHVMLYVGGREWLEADPNPRYGDRVITQTVPTTNGWFASPARFVRWTWWAEEPEPAARSRS